MNLRNRLFQNPATLMMIGMTCLLLASLPSFVHVLTTWNPDAVDFLRGLMMGLSIGFNLLAVWLFAHKTRRAK